MSVTLPGGESSLPLTASACDDELHRIARWWLDYAQDNAQGGFVGEVSASNQITASASKGVVMNTRILWFFSEAAHFAGNDEYRLAADRAFEYLQAHFLDRENGGYFWSLNADGSVLDDKKQVYAQGFAIYALAAYYELTHKPQALEAAMACFELIETHCVDRQQQGYWEAYTRSWGEIDDIRLSEKDLDYPKTMNTHLHVLEAYTKLYQVHKNEAVRQALSYGIDLFDTYMIDRTHNHLRMFMDNDWVDHSPALTFGHDIECAWLLYKALQSLGDSEKTEKLLPDIIALAKTCQTQALDKYGAVIDGIDKSSGAVHAERVWWVQAEALVGFLFAWKLSGDNSLYTTAAGVWRVIQDQIIDHEGGEWFWNSKLDQGDVTRGYKAGFWKGPYHNGRAMIEAAKLLREVSAL